MFHFVENAEGMSLALRHLAQIKIHCKCHSHVVLVNYQVDSSRELIRTFILPLQLFNLSTLICFDSWLFIFGFEPEFPYSRSWVIALDFFFLTTNGSWRRSRCYPREHFAGSPTQRLWRPIKTVILQNNVADMRWPAGLRFLHRLNIQGTTTFAQSDLLEKWVALHTLLISSVGATCSIVREHSGQKNFNALSLLSNFSRSSLV